jgi:hypothetical protein
MLTLFSAHQSTQPPVAIVIKAAVLHGDIGRALAGLENGRQFTTLTFITRIKEQNSIRNLSGLGLMEQSRIARATASFSERLGLDGEHADSVRRVFNGAVLFQESPSACVGITKSPIDGKFRFVIVGKFYRDAP